VDYDEESCIEQEDDLYLEDINELENSNYNLVIFTIERFLMRFNYDIASFKAIISNLTANIDSLAIPI